MSDNPHNFGTVRNDFPVYMTVSTGIPDGLAGLILAAASGSLVTIAGTAVLFWLGWI